MKIFMLIYRQIDHLISKEFIVTDTATEEFNIKVVVAVQRGSQPDYRADILSDFSSSWSDYLGKVGTMTLCF